MVNKKVIRCNLFAFQRKFTHQNKLIPKIHSNYHKHLNYMLENRELYHNRALRSLTKRKPISITTVINTSFVTYEMKAFILPTSL